MLIDDKYLVVPTSELRKLIAGNKAFGSLEALCIDLCGGVTSAGRMLYRLFNWWTKSTHPEGWVYKDFRDWWAELRLSQKQVATAGAALEIAGVEVKLMKGRLDCPRNHYRLNGVRFMAALVNVLGIDIETVKNFCEPFAKSVVANVPFGNRQKVDSENTPTAAASLTGLTTDSSSLYKQEETTPDNARAQNTDVDVSQIASTGEHFLKSTEGTDSSSTFEATRHESDAPENPLPVPQGFPLPKLVEVLVRDHQLNPLIAARYVEQHGVEYCERVAEVAMKGRTPPGLWRKLLDNGDYKDAPTKRDPWREMDKFIIK